MTSDNPLQIVFDCLTEDPAEAALVEFGRFYERNNGDAPIGAVLKMLEILQEGALGVLADDALALLLRREMQRQIAAQINGETLEITDLTKLLAEKIASMGGIDPMLVYLDLNPDGTDIDYSQGRAMPPIAGGKADLLTIDDFGMVDFKTADYASIERRIADFSDFARDLTKAKTFAEAYGMAPDRVECFSNPFQSFTSSKATPLTVAEHAALVGKPVASKPITVTSKFENLLAERPAFRVERGETIKVSEHHVNILKQITARANAQPDQADFRTHTCEACGYITILQKERFQTYCERCGDVLMVSYTLSRDAASKGGVDQRYG